VRLSEVRQHIVPESRPSCTEGCHWRVETLDSTCCWSGSSSAASGKQARCCHIAECRGL